MVIIYRSICFLLLAYLVSSIANSQPANIGIRPYYLVEKMRPSPLKEKLKKCRNINFSKTDFSMGHRGACLQFPEHTQESYEAAATMGAGYIECDITFTKDHELVCRHSQCDLHTTTDVLLRPELAGKCSVPFDKNNPQATKCCTSDFSLQEFKSLCGKMDGANKTAKSPEKFVKGTPDWRTDLYAQCGKLLTHKESLQVISNSNSKVITEIKAPEVNMPHNGFSRADYLNKVIEEYQEFPKVLENVLIQSFEYQDLLFLANFHPEFKDRLIYLDGRGFGNNQEDRDHYGSFNPNQMETWEPRSMRQIKLDGITNIAPPFWMLLTLDDQGKIIPSLYAKEAKKEGLNIYGWSLERSGSLVKGGGWFYQGINAAINNDGQVMEILQILKHEVGIKGIFTDWPETVTYFDNCDTVTN